MADQFTLQNSERVASHSDQRLVREFPFRIEVRPMLTCGGVGSGPNTIFILLADDLNRQEATKTLWHEIVHVLLAAGKHSDHDETMVEDIAGRLAKACPEIIAICGVEAHFANTKVSGPDADATSTGQPEPGPLHRHG